MVQGVNPSSRTPLWMRERLRRAGLRPIRPVVDVTNYVMLELGQPLHAYDLRRLSGGIEVRHGRAGESLRLLDGREIPVGTANGMMVPLAQLATIQTREGPATISREALERRLLVEANVRGRDLVSYVGESRARVEAEVKLPQGYKLVWAGQFENFTRAKDRLL